MLFAKAIDQKMNSRESLRIFINIVNFNINEVIYFSGNDV